MNTDADARPALGLVAVCSKFHETKAVMRETHCATSVATRVRGIAVNRTVAKQNRKGTHRQVNPWVEKTSKRHTESILRGVATPGVIQPADAARDSPLYPAKKSMHLK